MSRTLPFFAVLLLAGCATTPQALQGQFAPMEPGDAVRTGATGDLVRWGGRVVKVETQSAESCFEVVGIRLGNDSRPLDRDQSSGRFIACRTGFYDPEIFQPGREVTISGQISEFQTRKVGDYDYRYPVLQADVIYLWPERQEMTRVVEPYPFYGYRPYYPFWW